MKAKFVAFSEIEIDGQSYDFDVLIDKGKVHKEGKLGSDTTFPTVAGRPKKLESCI